MNSLRTIAIAATLATFCVTGFAQQSAEHNTHHPEAATGNMPMVTDPDAQMAGMDEQMKAMQTMHGKMKMAKTPAERSALMAEHMKLMKGSMAMMGEMDSGGMMGKMDKDGMKDKAVMGAHHKMMEKRMQMMQSMMQMMLDRMPPVPDKS